MDRNQPLVQGDAGITPIVQSSKAHEAGDDTTKKDKKSLAVAICTVVFSIPALIGACCWPAIVLPLVGVAITTGARHTAHLISLLVDLVIIGGLCVYVSYKARERDPYPYSFKAKWGPMLLCWLSFPFIMADPFRHVLGDYSIWEGCNRSCGEKWPSHCDWSSNEYKCALTCGELFDPPYCADPDHGPDGCSPDTPDCKRRADGSYPIVDCVCVHDAQEDAAHLSAMGIAFTIFFTYFGFALFMVGNLWNANIIDKCRDIRHKYRVLRGLSEDDEF